MKPILGEPACAPVPSGSAISSARDVMAKTARGICIGDEACMRPCDGEDGLCTDHRKENA